MPENLLRLNFGNDFKMETQFSQLTMSTELKHVNVKKYNVTFEKLTMVSEFCLIFKYEFPKLQSSLYYIFKMPVHRCLSKTKVRFTDYAESNLRTKPNATRNL